MTGLSNRRARIGRLLAFLLTLAAAMAIASAAANGADDHDRRAVARIAAPPLGLPPVPVPADNPVTAEKVALGRKLFMDRRLSRNSTMSCAMCHIPEQGFTNNELKTPVGVEGRSLRRNAPTILNVAYARAMFHDARDDFLETQVFGPLLARVEMANPSVGAVLATIRGLDDYAGLFERAFGGPANAHTLGQALATYQRTVLAANTPFDRWYYGGDQDAISPRAAAGFELFTGKAGCSACHLVGEESALFTDHGLHDTGVGYARETASDESVMVEIAPGVSVPVARAVIRSVGLPPEKDLGRLEVTDDPDDLYKYRTPSLRNVALTAPYMHDGSLQTLTDVVRFYDRGGVPHDGLDPLIEPLGLRDDEVAALVAFLESLTGEAIDDLIADARSVGVGG